MLMLVVPASATRAATPMVWGVQLALAGITLAKTMDYAAVKRAAAVAQDLQSQVHQRAGQLSEVLRRTARALESSAALAEEHAERREQGGRSGEAANERATAGRASEAARHARARAEELREYSSVPGR